MSRDGNFESELCNGERLGDAARTTRPGGEATVVSAHFRNRGKDL